MSNGKKCPLCDGTAKDRQRDPSGRDAIYVECDRCGTFRITDQALMGLSADQKQGLSSFSRRAGAGKAVVEILSTNIEQLVKSLPHYTPTEKLNNLLQLMAEMTPALGEYTEFRRDRDYPLLVLSRPSELEYLLQELFSREYVTGTHDGLALTMDGWEHLEQIRRKG